MFADAIADANGKLYIHGGGVTRVDPPALPMILAALSVLIRLDADPEDVGTDHRVDIALLDPEGEPIARADGAFVVQEPLHPMLEGETIVFNLVFNLGGLPIDREGLYKMDIRLDGEDLTTLPLAVASVPSGTATQ